MLSARARQLMQGWWAPSLLAARQPRVQATRESDGLGCDRGLTSEHVTSKRHASALKVVAAVHVFATSCACQGRQFSSSSCGRELALTPSHARQFPPVDAQRLPRFRHP